MNQSATKSPLPVGRLAPSPTGAQHVGNARTYLLAWLSIRSRGGRLILRMEDIDSPRVKPGAAEQAIAKLQGNVKPQVFDQPQKGWTRV